MDQRRIFDDGFIDLDDVAFNRRIKIHRTLIGVEFTADLIGNDFFAVVGKINRRNFAEFF